MIVSIMLLATEMASVPPVKVQSLWGSPWLSWDISGRSSSFHHVGLVERFLEVGTLVVGIVTWTFASWLSSSKSLGPGESVSKQGVSVGGCWDWGWHVHCGDILLGGSW